MYSIRRFGVIRTATIVAVMYVIVIAVFFIPIALIAALVGTSINGAAAGGAGLVATLLFGLVAALFYGAFGWVFTALACLLYNLAAGWVGGIQMQLEAVAPPSAPAVWAPTTPVAQTTATDPSDAPPLG